MPFVRTLRSGNKRPHRVAPAEKAPEQPVSRLSLEENRSGCCEGGQLESVACQARGGQ